MAPEQAAGARVPVEIPADVYALGAILYFLLTLRAPFEGEAAQRRTHGEPAAVPASPRRLAPAAPRPLESIAGKAMALSPSDRYASADELRAEIARYLDGERVLAHREGLSERAGRVFARYRTPILLITAYLLMRSLLLLYGRR
jgi:serine/threonine protein kinase